MNTTWMRAASCPDRLDLPWLADSEHVSVWERLTMAAICDQCPVLLACAAFVADQDITAVSGPDGLRGLRGLGGAA